jgi:hypothetical protein
MFRVSVIANILLLRIGPATCARINMYIFLASYSTPFDYEAHFVLTLRSLFCVQGSCRYLLLKCTFYSHMTGPVKDSAGASQRAYMYEAGKRINIHSP